MPTMKKTNEHKRRARTIATAAELRLQGYRNRIVKVTLPTFKFTEPADAEEVHA